MEFGPGISSHVNTTTKYIGDSDGPPVYAESGHYFMPPVVHTARRVGFGMDGASMTR